MLIEIGRRSVNWRREKNYGRNDVDANTAHARPRSARISPARRAESSPFDNRTQPGVGQNAAALELLHPEEVHVAAMVQPANARRSTRRGDLPQRVSPLTRSISNFSGRISQ